LQSLKPSILLIRHDRLRGGNGSKTPTSFIHTKDYDFLNRSPREMKDTILQPSNMLDLPESVLSSRLATVKKEPAFKIARR
jgi:hypothetical protein